MRARTHSPKPKPVPPKKPAPIPAAIAVRDRISFLIPIVSAEIGLDPTCRGGIIWVVMTTSEMIDEGEATLAGLHVRFWKNPGEKQPENFGTWYEFPSFYFVISVEGMPSSGLILTGTQVKGLVDAGDPRGWRNILHDVLYANSDQVDEDVACEAINTLMRYPDVSGDIVDEVMQVLAWDIPAAVVPRRLQVAGVCDWAYADGVVDSDGRDHGVFFLQGADGSLRAFVRIRDEYGVPGYTKMLGGAGPDGAGDLSGWLESRVDVAGIVTAGVVDDSNVRVEEWLRDRVDGRLVDGFLHLHHLTV